ncbi:MAG: type IV-A pilus assembly ATPase PilB [Proteobacteria bacterium]|jgi:type IV pilus assembly protein PilB|nr:type IV-A pilus assembly ATPase PilB [Pseudomonadota bacterium]
MATQPYGGIAGRLIEQGKLDAPALARAQRQAERDGSTLNAALLAQPGLDTAAFAAAASELFGLPLLDLSAFDLRQAPRGLLSEPFLRKHQLLPLFRRGQALFVGIADPADNKGLSEGQFHSGLTFEPIVVDHGQLLRQLDGYLSKQSEALLSGLEDDALIPLEADAAPESTPLTSAEDSDEAPVVRFVNKVLLDAIRSEASDIHFEPYEHRYRIRFRTDGMLREIASPPVSLGLRLAARLKVMARMDISERRIPQDGRIKLRVSQSQAVDFRVNTLPTLYGEKVVLRILDPSSAKLGIDALGYEPDQKALFLEALQAPQGMILVTGPTGSGKTVSLYTGLHILNTAERNIATAEDPVEINLEGINQVHVNPKVGLDFAAALRAFLRQDPDVVMVGEVRDLETAEVAIKAAQTGHLVLSTLHTNSAPETLTRLRNMGVPSFNVATSVSLIIAQRLARRLCSRCKQAQTVPEAALLELGFEPEDFSTPFTLFEAREGGCEHCMQGYRGRVGIYEVVKITPRLQRLILEDANALALGEAARQEGFINLRRAGVLKAKAGVTSLLEISRVTAASG